MKRCNLKEMSDHELAELSIEILEELKEREEAQANGHAAAALTYAQNTRAGAIVRRADGTPVDRDGWFYLPFLKTFSKLFQPERKDGVSRYRDVFREGEVLQITTPEGLGAIVKVGGPFGKVAIGGAEITGPITVI